MFEWIDPFAEIDALKLRNESAYQRGQASVLEDMLGDERKTFARVLEHRVAELAEHVAIERVKPHMFEHYDEYRAALKRADLLRDHLRAVARPLVMNIQATGELGIIPHPRIYEDSASYTLTIHTKMPFEYHVGMSVPYAP